MSDKLLVLLKRTNQNDLLVIFLPVLCLLDNWSLFHFLFFLLLPLLASYIQYTHHTYIPLNKEKKMTNRRLYGPKAKLILDAPNFTDDPISQTLDWNNNNILSIALGGDVYCYGVQEGCTDFLTSTIGTISALHSYNNDQELLISSNEGCICTFDLCTLALIEKEKQICYGGISDGGCGGIKLIKSNQSNLFLAIPKIGISIRDFRMKCCNRQIRVSKAITSMDVKDEKISLTHGRGISIYDVRRLDEELYFKEYEIETPNNITFSPFKRGHIAWGSSEGKIKVMDYRTEGILQNIITSTTTSSTTGLFWLDEDSLIESHDKTVSLCKNGDVEKITDQFIVSPTKLIPSPLEGRNTFITSAPDDVIKFFQIYK